MCLAVARTTDPTILTETLHGSVHDHDKRAIQCSMCELLKRKWKQSSKKVDWRDSIQCSLGFDGIVYGMADSSGLVIFAGVSGFCHAHIIWQILHNLIEKAHCLQIVPSKPKAALVGQLLKSMHQHMRACNKHLAERVLIECEEECECGKDGSNTSSDAVYSKHSAGSIDSGSTRSSESSALKSSQGTRLKRFRSWLGV